MADRHRLSAACAALGLIVTAAGVTLARSGPARAGLPVATADSPTGMYANGALLMNGRLVTPAGAITPLGDLPLGIVLSPDESFAVVANSGQGEGGAGQGNESLQVIDIAHDRVVQTIEDHQPNADTFFNAGLAFSADGKHLYAAGGGNDAVYDYSVNGMHLTLASTWISTLDHGQPPVPIPTGLTPGIPRDAPLVGNAVGFTRGLAATPDGKSVLVVNEQGDSVASLAAPGGRINWETQLGGTLDANAYPGSVALSHDGTRAYVTQQGLNHVVTLDVATGAILGSTPVGDHPTAIAVSRDSAWAFVSNANDDSLSILDLTGPVPQQSRQLSTHLFKGEANGSTPNAVAIDEDRGLVYVANAGDNAVAVFGNAHDAAAAAAGASSPPSPRASPVSLPNTAASSFNPATISLQGFVPTAMYPTALAARPSDGMLLAVAAKGYGGVPVTRNDEYDGNDMVGLLSRVASPTQADLVAGANKALENLRFGTSGNSRRSPGNPIPDAAHPGQSPIKHVVLIVRENRTFDQVFGDLHSLGHPEADVVPDYLVFPRVNSQGKTITPNAHNIIGRFGGSDNFYSDGEASIQGHHWTAEGVSSDYTEKSWIHYYSNRLHTYDPTAPTVYPRCGAIFQHLAAAGKTFRDFGELVGLTTSQPPTATVAPDSSCATPGGVQDPKVAANTDPVYPNNLALTSVKDTDRLSEFKNAFAPLVQADQVPQFTYLLMGNDHTDGTSAGKHTPQALVATNDQAVGGVIDYLSHTPQWASTAVFIEEDDSQDGLDHRDGHRNILLVASPYAVPGKISHVHTSQASVMSMIELILGVDPISSYSQSAPIPYDLFQATPNPAPYTMEVPTYDQAAVNSTGSPSGASAIRLDTRTIDTAGPLLEAQIWEATRPGEPYPRQLRQEISARGIRVPQP